MVTGQMSPEEADYHAVASRKGLDVIDGVMARRAADEFRRTYKRLDELDQRTIDRVLATPHGKRPDPSFYLSDKYISEHLSHFQGGASRLVRRSDLKQYGLAHIKDGTAFVVSSKQVDELLAATGGDLRAIERAWGMPAG